MNALQHALGHRALTDLATVAGGRLLNIPLRHHPDGALARLVGRDLAKALVASFGGGRVYIPRGPSPFNGPGKPIDRAMVIHLTAKGLTAQAIADLLQCTTRTVYRKRAPATPGDDHG